jgi:hypothetical protein
MMSFENLINFRCPSALPVCPAFNTGFAGIFFINKRARSQVEIYLRVAAVGNEIECGTRKKQ